MPCCVSLSCARLGADSLINMPILMLKSLEKAVPSVMDGVMHSRILLRQDAFKVSVSGPPDSSAKINLFKLQILQHPHYC